METKIEDNYLVKYAEYEWPTKADNGQDDDLILNWAAWGEIKCSNSLAWTWLPQFPSAIAFDAGTTGDACSLQQWDQLRMDPKPSPNPDLRPPELYRRNWSIQRRDYQNLLRAIWFW